MMAKAAPFSIACWFKWEGGQLDNRIIALGNSAQTDYFAISYRDNRSTAYDYYFQGYVWDGSTTESIANYNTVTGAGTSSWWHLIAVFTEPSNQQVALYVDGDFKDSSTHTFTMSTINRMTIGVSADSTPFGYTSAYIDQVGLWNRALDSTDAGLLYNSGSGLAFSSW